MDISYDPYGLRRPRESRPWMGLLLLVALLVTAGALAGVVALPGETHHEEAVPGAEEVSRLVYPTSLLEQIQQPSNGQWRLPIDITTADGYTFVLDTANSRILKLDLTGRILASLDSASDERLVLDQPMAVVSDGRSLFVANSLAAEILVLDLSGRVERVLPLQPVTTGAKDPRPIGLALTAEGNIVVSDANNHRVLVLNSEGTVLKTIGAGTRAAGADGFNVPGAITVDSTGNIYVVDILNGRVVKLSPDGAFVQQFGELGDVAGTFSRPKGVAVDAEGRVYVSDGMLMAVQVFSAEGAYLGVIGRSDPTDPTSESIFQAPAGLWLDDDELYVMDRIVGLLKFRLLDPLALGAPEGAER